MEKITLHPSSKKVEASRPNLRLDGDAVGQLLASMIAEHLGDLHQLREDINAKCVHPALLPGRLRNQVEADARFAVNVQDQQLRQAAIWKAAEALADHDIGESFDALPLVLQRRCYALALRAITTYVSVLNGSHDALTVQDYTAAAVAYTKHAKESEQ